MTDKSRPPRCTYVFDPETWAAENDAANRVSPDELNEDGVWQCPHSCHDDHDLCIFHLPESAKEDTEVQAEFLNQIARPGKADKQFIGASFGDLHLEHSILESTDNYPIDLRHATFTGDVSLYFAIIRQPLIVEGATFDGNVNFNDTKFDGGAFFSDSTFQQEAYFVEAVFPEGGYFYNSLFHGDTDFSQAIFEGHVDFINVTFQRVHFREASFADLAEFKGAEFHLAMFWGVTFEDKALFNEATFPHRANFREAEFRDTARFTEVTLQSARSHFDLRRSMIRAGSLVQPGDGTIIYDLKDAQIGDVQLQDPEGSIDLFQQYRFWNTTFDGFDFGNYRDTLSGNDWTIHTIIPHQDANFEALERPSSGDLENTYLKAKNGANEIGDTKASAEFFQKEMVYRRRQHALEVQRADVGFWHRTKAGGRWTANSLLAVTAGYGERPYRVVGSSIIVIGCFSLLFAYLRPSPPYESPVGYLILSLESFVTLVLGGAAGVTDPWIRLFGLIDGFIGAFLIALFVFTLTRSIHR